MFIKIIPCETDEPTYIHVGDIIEITPRDGQCEVRLRDGDCLRVEEPAESILRRLGVAVIT